MVKKIAASKKIVIAIGGNSLVKNGKQSASFGGHAPVTWQKQFETVRETTRSIADIVEQGYRVVITHGNGPQVGEVLIRAYLTRNHLPDIPLDMANAITQSEIGYMIQQSLRNELLKRNRYYDVVTVITQVVVDKNDRVFSYYSKPVGPFYSKREAFALQRERKWVMREDAGRGYRRFVSSPEPKEIVEINIIRNLLESGAIVIAGGGGGIPVFRNTRNELIPAGAVIDKDLTSALLADVINADILLISTSVEQVYINFNKPDQKPLFEISAKQAKDYYNDGHFGQGSMGPKICAGIKFLTRQNEEEKFDTEPTEKTLKRFIRCPLGVIQCLIHNNRMVIITNPKNLSKAISNKKTGTRITKL